MADDSVAALEADLRAEGAGRPGPLARSVQVVRAAVIAVVGAVIATGVGAFGVGVVATRGSVPGMVVMGVLCAPAVLAPLAAARRAAPLAEAAAHPAQLAQQALDLVRHARTAPSVGALAREAVRQVRTGRRRGPHGAGLRGSLAIARRAATVVAEVGPDPDRYRLIVSLRPANLRRLGLAVLLSLWAWAVAAAAGISALVVLVVDRL